VGGIYYSMVSPELFASSVPMPLGAEAVNWGFYDANVDESGFAIGTQNAYVAGPGYNAALKMSDIGSIDRFPLSEATPDAGPFAAATVVTPVTIARGQPTPTSLALDGTYVYWTTTDCDIRYVADSPQ
jgi:hypothetical protein